MTLSRFPVGALAACALLALAAHATRAHAGGATISAPTRPPAVCFAPHTDRALVEEYARAFGIGPSQNARGSAGLSVAASQYQDGARWTSTATNGWGLAQGDPTTLTWSIVPDGTPIAGALGEPAAPSNLRAYLNGIYGSEAAWLPIFQQVFARWAELTGMTYVYQPTDDGVAMFSYSGVLGVRGDVRIGGHTIDGNYNVLAYNYYPNVGDMVLDTGDAFFTNTGSGSLRLRNTLAHEHGHGLGLPHNCPVNQTKLMEPTLTLAFDGPQHDDVLGANRAYGDDLEHNDQTSSGSDLGALSNGTVTVQGLSADDDADVDYFLFRVGPGKKATVTVTPVGSTYLQGPQSSTGSCSAGTAYDSRAQSDLAVQLLDADGQTVLGTAGGQAAGQAETLANVALPSGSATYFVRVLPGTSNAAQLYDLGLTIGDVVPPSDAIFSDDFDGTTLAAWSSSADGGGDLLTSPAAAMAGARGLAAVLDGTARLWVQDDTPDAEARYRVRFWFDPNDFT
ncbi:MAG: matrixin family metalloprotease, partial [Thermodesulfobacteriota bacterium]